MRWVGVLGVIGALSGGAAGTAVAQTITIDDPAGARAGLKVGYMGHGADWETSIDSPLVAEFMRVRGSLGFGRWVDGAPTPGLDPWVARAAASVVFFIRPLDPRQYIRRSGTEPRFYFGVGIAAYMPVGVAMRAQKGTRIFLGVEGWTAPWTFGPEIELDVPRGKGTARPFSSGELPLGARVGFAVRRLF